MRFDFDDSTTALAFRLGPEGDEPYDGQKYADRSTEDADACCNVTQALQAIAFAITQREVFKTADFFALLGIEAADIKEYKLSAADAYAVTQAAVWCLADASIERSQVDFTDADGNTLNGKSPILYAALAAFLALIECKCSSTAAAAASSAAVYAPLGAALGTLSVAGADTLPQQARFPAGLDGYSATLRSYGGTALIGPFKADTAIGLTPVITIEDAAKPDSVEEAVLLDAAGAPIDHPTPGEPFYIAIQPLDSSFEIELHVQTVDNAPEVVFLGPAKPKYGRFLPGEAAAAVYVACKPAGAVLPQEEAGVILKLTLPAREIPRQKTLRTITAVNAPDPVPTEEDLIAKAQREAKLAKLREARLAAEGADNCCCGIPVGGGMVAYYADYPCGCGGDGEESDGCRPHCHAGHWRGGRCGQIIVIPQTRAETPAPAPRKASPIVLMSPQPAPPPPTPAPAAPPVVVVTQPTPPPQTICVPQPCCCEPCLPPCCAPTNPCCCAALAHPVIDPRTGMPMPDVAILTPPEGSAVLDQFLQTAGVSSSMVGGVPVSGIPGGGPGGECVHVCQGVPVPMPCCAAVPDCPPAPQPIIIQQPIPTMPEPFITSPMPQAVPFQGDAGQPIQNHINVMIQDSDRNVSVAPDFPMQGC
jgi:hypothetical protein